MISRWPTLKGRSLSFKCVITVSARSTMILPVPRFEEPFDKHLHFARLRERRPSWATKVYRMVPQRGINRHRQVKSSYVQSYMCFYGVSTYIFHLLFNYCVHYCYYYLQYCCIVLLLYVTKINMTDCYFKLCT